AGKVVFNRQRRNSLQGFGGINHPGWIVRCVENNAASAWRDRFRELINVDLETLFHRRKRNGSGSSQTNLLRQRHPKRRWDDDFIARLKENEVRVEERLF